MSYLPITMDVTAGTSSWMSFSFFCFKKASPIPAALGVLFAKHPLSSWESLSVNKRSGFPPQWNFVPVSAISLSLRQSLWGLKAALGSAGSPHPLLLETHQIVTQELGGEGKAEELSLLLHAPQHTQPLDSKPLEDCLFS